MRSNFEWLSPLGISTTLFIIIGVVYTMLGILGPFLYYSGAAKITKQIFLGEQADTYLLGKTPEEFMNESPQVEKFIELMMIVAWSLSAGMGILQLGVTYFALKPGESWALWTLGISNMLTLSVFWFIIIIPVIAKINISWWKSIFIHPYAFIPTILFPIAMILGWIALRK